MAKATRTGRKRGRRIEMTGSARAESSADGKLTVRSMPESLAAEAAVLGSMLIDPRCIADVIEILGRDAFYRVEHQHIYDSLIALYEKNKGVGIDAVLLRDELEKRKVLEDVGGVEYIARILDSVPSAASVEYYAGIVKEKMLLRELIDAASGILDDAYGQSGEACQRLEDAGRRIFWV